MVFSFESGDIFGNLQTTSHPRWYSVRSHKDHRIDRPRASRSEVQLEVQVGPRAVPRRADSTYDLPDSNGLSFNDCGPGEHVTVAGVDLASVPDVDVPAATRRRRGPVPVTAVACRHDVAPHHQNRSR